MCAARKCVVAFRCCKDCSEFQAIEIAAFKCIAPRLRVAALPCVAIRACAIEIYISATPASQQIFGQEEKPGCARVGLVVQNPPFYRAAIVASHINVVVACADFCGVIARNPACAKLYRLACPRRKRHGGEHIRRHAKVEQDTEYSFLHWLFSSCSCRVGLSAPSFF